MYRAFHPFKEIRSAVAVSVFLSIMLSCFLSAPAFGLTKTQSLNGTMTIELIKSEEPEVKPDPEPEVKPDPAPDVTPDVEQPTTPQVNNTPTSEAKPVVTAQDKKVSKPIGILPETGDTLLIVAGISSILLTLLCLFCFRSLRPAPATKGQSNNKFAFSLPIRLLCIFLVAALIMAGIAISQNKAQALDEADTEESSSQVATSNNYGFSFMARAEVDETGEVEMSMVVASNKTIHMVTGVAVLTPADLIGWDAGMSDTNILSAATYSNHWKKADKITSPLLAQLKASKDSTVVIDLTANVTYELQEVFFADSTIDLNGDLLNAEMYSMKELTDDAHSFAGLDPNAIIAERYSALNDKYHLFALLNKRVDGTSADGTRPNDWLECRIIHTGQHDNDGSGLTFQAIHALPQRYQWDTSWQNGDQAPNWANCTLRSTMNEAIFSSLPSVLQGSIRAVAKEYNTTAGSNPNGGSSATVTDKLWLISATELISNVAGKQPDCWSDNSHQGSTYAFWNSKNLVTGKVPASGSEQQRLFYAMNCDRAGTLLKYSSWTDGCAWVRSMSPVWSNRVLSFRSDGSVSYTISGIPSYSHGVSPCFAL